MIYHIASAADWRQAQLDGHYTTSSLGVSLEQEGFIHASTADQVEGVANRYYTGVTELVLLVIDEGRLTSELRYDDVPGQPAPYPHIYGPLNVDAIIEAQPLAAGAEGRFTFSPGDLT
jgi:uncharacterized protein (DUF952 family)